MPQEAPASVMRGRQFWQSNFLECPSATVSTCWNCFHTKVGKSARSRPGSAPVSERSTGLDVLPTYRRKSRSRGSGVVLAFVTSANFLWERLMWRDSPCSAQNQIVNASKFQLGELYTHDKLERALENIRQLMQGRLLPGAHHAETISHAEYPPGGRSVPHHPRRAANRGSDGDEFLGLVLRKFKGSPT